MAMSSDDKAKVVQRADMALTDSTNIANQITTIPATTKSTKNSKLTGIALKGFRFAPPEVREIIFREVATERRKYGSFTPCPLKNLPNLLQALHNDTFLYREAFARYMDKDCIFVFQWQETTRDEMAMIPFEEIQRLEICFGLVHSHFCLKSYC